MSTHNGNGNGNGNGHGPAPTSPFAKAIAPEIPIIGQPFEIKNWFVTVMIVCKCHHPEPVLIAGQIGAVGQCANCKRVFQMRVVKSDEQTGKVNFGIQMAMPVAAPEPASVT